MPLREPGRLLTPLVGWAAIAVLAWLWLAPRSSLPGWQLAVIIVAAIPLSGLVAFGLLGGLAFLVSVPFELGDRMARKRFRRFASLLELRDEPAAVDEGRRLAGAILDVKEGRFHPELEDAPSVLAGASEPGPLQEECLSILLAHGRGGEDQARALYAGRAALADERLDEWVRWFSMWAEPKKKGEEDARPRAYAHALERTEGEARRRVLNRLLVEARPVESWRSVAREMQEELRALDPDELAPLEREGLATLLGEGDPGSVGS